MLRQMTKHLTVFALAAALFAPLGSFGDESGTLLLWQVYDNYGDPDNPTPMIPDTSPTDLKFIDELRSRPDGYEANGAMVRVVGATGENGETIYLDMFSLNKEDGSVIAKYDQSMLPLPRDPDGYFTSAGPVWTDFGNYADTAYSFLVELGHMDENGNWTVMAVSETATYEALQAAGFTTSDAVNYPNMTPWTPTFTVPEPSSGLLLLVGGALLSLRRKRRSESRS